MHHWTHEQLEGFMGRWFMDRDWVPVMSELEIGKVVGGGAGLKPYFKDGGLSEEMAREVLADQYNRAWVADVAGLALVSKSRLYTMKLGHLWEQYKKAVEPMPYYLTWLCEVKVTRSDFLKDDKFDKPPQAHLQFLAVPRGLIDHGEIPKGWGLLEVAYGKSLGRVFKNMDCFLANEVERRTEFRFMEQLVWSMWWRHYHESSRDFQRKQRERDASVRDANKVSAIIEATLAYVQRKSLFIEGRDPSLCAYLRERRVRRRPTGWAQEQADKLRERLKE